VAQRGGENEEGGSGRENFGLGENGSKSRDRSRRGESEAASPSHTFRRIHKARVGRRESVRCLETWGFVRWNRGGKAAQKPSTALAFA
jgi:hypothetical protein